MNLSMKWLNDFVDINEPIYNFTNAMTMSGSKVENFSEEGKLIKKVVVGKILKIGQHPNADKLVVCKVSVSDSEDPIQIVTGAKNLKVGDLVPVALNGSTIADGRKIKKGKLRGEISQGMMCSLEELGLTKNDFPYAIDDGIFVLEEDCEIGDDIKSAIGLNDVKVEFEITSNRADCFSMIGLSREVAATFNKELKLHTPKIKKEIDNVGKLLSAKINNYNLCPFYSARVIKNVKIESSPRWIRERLRAMGVRPINNIIDITNYVMLEYGQPMHAFDLSSVREGKLLIREANEGEILSIIDGSKIKLSRSDLVIADESNSSTPYKSSRPIALAGVMGGKDSSIKNDTKTVIFESANFRGSTIRATAKRHGLRTESSSRFEKNLDSNICLKALDRACELVELLGAGDIVKGVVCDGKINTKETLIELDCNFINSFLSLSLSKSEIVSILEKVGCKIINDKVQVPSFRNDLECKADIAEEVARFYGYNNIKSMPLKINTQGKYNNTQFLEKKVIQTMLSLGFDQVITSSFENPQNYTKIRMDKNKFLKDSVKIRNALGETTSSMRTTAIPSMLEIMSQNYNNKNNNVKFFEIAKEYIKISSDVLPEEKNKLIVGAYGKDFNFFNIKGVLEEFLGNIFLHNYDIEASQSFPEFHPGRCAVIMFAGMQLGVMGEVHPIVCENYKIDQCIYLISIDLDLLFKNINKQIKFRSLPKYPAVIRDLCLICDKQTPIKKITDIISNSIGEELLEDINLFDVYSGEQVESGKKSVAFSIKIRSYESTLNDDQITCIIKRTIDELEKVGIILRK